MDKLDIDKIFRKLRDYLNDKEMETFKEELQEMLTHNYNEGYNEGYKDGANSESDVCFDGFHI